MGYGKKIVIGDKKGENAREAARILNNVGFDTEPVEMDLSSRTSIRNLIDRAAELRRDYNAGQRRRVSPSQAPIEAILKVDLYGTAVLLEEVGKVIGEGGAGVTISNQSGHRMPALTPQEDRLLACAPGRRAAWPAIAARREYSGYAPCLSAGQTLQRKEGDSRIRQMGRKRGPPEFHLPRHCGYSFGYG